MRIFVFAVFHAASPVVRVMGNYIEYIGVRKLSQIGLDIKLISKTCLSFFGGVFISPVKSFSFATACSARVMGDYIEYIEEQQAVSNRDLATCLSGGFPISLNGEVEGGRENLTKSVQWDTLG